MVVNKINSLAEYKELVLEKQDGVLKVIDSFAEWCPPCKAIAPVLEKLSEQYTEVNFYKIDVDAVPDVAQELGVRAMPTFAFFKNGNKVDEVVGANPPAIEKSIKEFK
ncbi:hypothetical protein FQN57_003191 [Myotisia sp. PD_48]|nr:hypothetical protein FQN57_003191 [Myotisia sp. PD_48]